MVANSLICFAPSWANGPIRAASVLAGSRRQTHDDGRMGDGSHGHELPRRPRSCIADDGAGHANSAEGLMDRSWTAAL